MRLIWLFVFSICLLGSNASASIVALWENNGLAGNEATAAPDLIGFGFAVTNLTRGNGLNAVAYQDTFGANGADSFNLADAITNEDYFEFVVSEGPGTTFYNLDSIALRLSGQNTTATDQTVYTVMSNVSGFSDGSELLQRTSSSLTDTATGGLGLTNLTGNTAIRIYVHRQGTWADNSPAFSQVGVGWAFNANSDDDIIVNGEMFTTPIPEPGSGLLLGIPVLIGLMRRRKV